MAVASMQGADQPVTEWEQKTALAFSPASGPRGGGGGRNFWRT